jgi:hypothetical protein
MITAAGAPTGITKIQPALMDMNNTMLSIGEAADFLASAIVTDRLDTGPEMITVGEHPSVGRFVLIQVEEAFTLVTVAPARALLAA